MRPLVILTHTNNVTQNNTVCITWGSNAEFNMGCGSHLKCQIRMTMFKQLDHKPPQFLIFENESGLD